MKKLIILVPAFLLIALSANAQTNSLPPNPTVEVEIGTQSELKGLTKIFVDTLGNVDEQKLIFKEFEKAKLKSVVLLNSTKGAEIILVFKSDTYRISKSRVSQGDGMNAISHITRSMGKGIAFIPLESNTIRVVFEMNERKESAFEKKPAIKFARAFIKAYEEANKLE